MCECLEYIRYTFFLNDKKLEENVIFPVLCYNLNVTKVDGCTVYYAGKNKMLFKRQ
jgi:hypothetical protein